MTDTLSVNFGDGLNSSIPISLGYLHFNFIILFEKKVTHVPINLTGTQLTYNIPSGNQAGNAVNTGTTFLLLNNEFRGQTTLQGFNMYFTLKGSINIMVS